LFWSSPASSRPPEEAETSSRWQDDRHDQKTRMSSTSSSPHTTNAPSSVPGGSAPSVSTTIGHVQLRPGANNAPQVFELASTKEQGPPSSMKPNAPSTPHSQIPTGALPVLVDGEHAPCGVEGESSEVNRCRRRGELAGRWCCHARGGENRRDERSRGKRDEIFHLNPHYTAGTRGASCEPAAPRAPGRQAPDSRARGNSSSSRGDHAPAAHGAIRGTGVRSPR
jgi:hypothetical protein